MAEDGFESGRKQSCGGKAAEVPSTSIVGAGIGVDTYKGGWRKKGTVRHGAEMTELLGAVGRHSQSRRNGYEVESGEYGDDSRKPMQDDDEENVVAV